MSLYYIHTASDYLQLGRECATGRVPSNCWFLNVRHYNTLLHILLLPSKSALVNTYCICMAERRRMLSAIKFLEAVVRSSRFVRLVIRSLSISAKPCSFIPFIIRVGVREQLAHRTINDPTRTHLLCFNCTIHSFRIRCGNMFILYVLLTFSLSSLI